MNEWLALSDTESNSPRLNNYSKDNLISGFANTAEASVAGVTGCNKLRPFLSREGGHHEFWN